MYDIVNNTASILDSYRGDWYWNNNDGSFTFYATSSWNPVSKLPIWNDYIITSIMRNGYSWFVAKNINTNSKWTLVGYTIGYYDVYAIYKNSLIVFYGRKSSYYHDGYIRWN
jgi:hypothetical protein